MLGNIGQVLSFTFIGPLPFIPMILTLPYATVCVAILGLSHSFVVTSTHARAQDAAIRSQIKQNPDTNRIISGLS